MALMHNPLDLTGCRYLITGAASGIGQATARLTSSLGAKVLCLDRDGPGLETTMQTLEGDGHRAECFDLANTAAIKARIAELVDAFGQLNGFVHAAGVPCVTPIRYSTMEQTHQVMAVNVDAALVLSRCFVSGRTFCGTRGSIVFVSSVLGQVGSPAASVYALTKGAVNALAKSLAMELAPKRIRVNCVAPGFVRTPMLDKLRQAWTADQDAKVESLHPLGYGTPDSVAGAIAFLLAETGSWITGTVLVVDGGYSAQ